VRIDELLVAEGLAVDAKEAAALCMAGKVIVSNLPISSPAVKVDPLAPVRLRGQKEHPWVSRGGMKLAHALEEFELGVEGAVACDVGCSTGGFTQVLLKGGASKVYAVDVGYGQLALPLRNDDRVVVMERTNARYGDESSGMTMQRWMSQRESESPFVDNVLH
jgi:23S rRNA (cytidine1920-2'-O)/16S rRNA (cytidine1409-2'-O)-methyltransferase